MTDIPTKLVVDCSLPDGHPDRVKTIPLTPEEIAQREADAEAAAIAQAEREAEKQRIADLKASAKAKLISGQALTEEEASILLG